MKVRNRVMLLQTEERRMLKKIEEARKKAQDMEIKRVMNDKLYL